MDQRVNNETSQKPFHPRVNPFAGKIKNGFDAAQVNALLETNPFIHPTIIDAINLRTMSSPEALSTYASVEGLKAAEQAAFSQIKEEVHGQPILDIGVGGGRTTKALMEISKAYIGIDYSAKMIETCQSRFPDGDFRHADARDLSQFSDNSFAMVVFSCEGLCMVDNEGRIAALKEIHRVLKPNGIFIFSTMNQHSDYHDRPFQFPDFEMSRNPARAGVRSIRFTIDSVNRFVNRMKNKKRDLRTEEYSIINDVYHNYGTMIYYISLENQRLQLESVGFNADATVLNLAGNKVKVDSTDNTLTFIAKKSARLQG